MFKKILITIGVFSLFVSPVFADSTASQDLGIDKFDPSQYLPVFKFGGVVDLLIGILFAVAVLFFIVRMIFSGMSIIGAGADAQKKQGAIKSMINAVVGLVLVILSVAITTLILSFFGITTTKSLLPDCKNATNKAICVENASKLIDPNNLVRDCNTIGGTVVSNKCRYQEPAQF